MLKSKNSIPVIAEIGVNHEGSFEKAKSLLVLAAESGADFVKFQSYTPERYASASNLERLKRVSKFALTEGQFKELSGLAVDTGVGFLSTPLTEDWVEELKPLVSAFKIASGDLTFKPVIQEAARSGKPLLISTGGATLDEIDQAVEWVRQEVSEENLKEKLTLMHCVSAYPTPIEEANVLSIPFLRERYNLNIGYSNHVMGVEASLAAVSLGASVVEVHFTDQKEGREFRDHALSFDPHDLKTFISMANKIKVSLGAFGKEPQPCEKEGIDLMRKGVVAAKDLRSGDTLTLENLMFARPATGFKSSEIEKLIGKTINQDIKSGCLIPKDAI